MAIAAVLAKVLKTQPNARQSGCLEEALYGPLGSMLFADGMAARRIDADVGHAHLLARALAYIDAGHTDSGLTPARMALDLKTSSRQLQRAFAALGTTPTASLQQQRLANACRALRQLRSAEGRTLISTIAYGVGFNDLSCFNRVFRATFGCTPGQYVASGTD